MSADEQTERTEPQVKRLERAETEWQRVSPKYIVVDVVGYVIFGALMTAAAFVPFWVGWEFGWLLGVGMAVLFLLVIAFTPRRVRSNRSAE